MKFQRAGSLGLIAALAVAAAAAASSGEAHACPFCGAAGLSWSEQFAGANSVLLVKWVSGTRPETDADTGRTVFEVVKKHKGPSEHKAGFRITLDEYRAAKKGDLFLLMGLSGAPNEPMTWSIPQEVTEASWKYLTEAPPVEASALERVAYYAGYLEHSDPLVAGDAFASFASIPFADVAAQPQAFSRVKLRKWLDDPDTLLSRRGLYGMLLGLVGDETDAEYLERRIVEPATEEVRFGIDGMMAGYLLLRGEKGLVVLDKLMQQKSLPFSERYSFMQALRFMWTYGGERVTKDRLRASMRGLVDRPEMADLVIADLARWKDWSVQKKLREMYGAEEYNIPTIKRAIVRYMLASIKDAPSGAGTVPDHVKLGQKYLEELRDRDPRTVQDVERYSAN